MGYGRWLRGTRFDTGGFARGLFVAGFVCVRQAADGFPFLAGAQIGGGVSHSLNELFIAQVVVGKQIVADASRQFAVVGVVSVAAVGCFGRF